MDTKASWEDWATRFVSAASIIALGYFVLFVDFTSQGRFWDKLAARVPALAKLIPPAAGSQATQVVKTMPDAEGYVDRTLIVGERAPEQAPAEAPPAAVPAQAQAQTQDVKKMAAPRLTSSLTPFNINDNSQNRVISVPVGTAAETAQTQAAPAAAAPAAQETAAPRTIAAKASYGAASRSEMMGQAAGPVYNLKGKSKKK
jgi:hypothetical protein